MTTAVAQRTVSICLSNRTADDAQISYSYWAPHDGMVRAAAPTCHMIEKIATNTLFVLDYSSTLNGWIITGIEFKGPHTLPVILGPASTSIMTIDKDHHRKKFSFYILYENTLTGATVQFDPQEGNEPGAS